MFSYFYYTLLFTPSSLPLLYLEETENWGMQEKGAEMVELITTLLLPVISSGRTVSTAAKQVMSTTATSGPQFLRHPMILGSRIQYS